MQRALVHSLICPVYCRMIPRIQLVPIPLLLVRVSGWGWTFEDKALNKKC